MPKRRSAPRKPVAPKPQPAPVVPAPSAVVVAPNQRQIPWVAIAILIVGGYWVYSNKQTPVVPVTPDAQPTVNQAVKTVADAATDKEAVKNLGRLYLAFGDVLSRSEPMGSSQLREWLVSADTYYYQGTDMIGKVPGFGKVKDEELAKILTLEDKELTKDDLTKVVAFCESVAGACGVKK